LQTDTASKSLNKDSLGCGLGRRIGTVTGDMTLLAAFEVDEYARDWWDEMIKTHKCNKPCAGAGHIL
jgi:hypothetical protein